jgi:hypothetical protein
MTTRYQKSQIEDVARTLVNFWADPINRFSYLHVPPKLAQDFADLFAADNPPTCSICRLATTDLLEEAGCQYEPESGTTSQHDFEGGFDRERFLAACGLEQQPESDEDCYATHEHNKDFPECYGLESEG